jgi:hypothetical protein
MYLDKEQIIGYPGKKTVEEVRKEQAQEPQMCQ